MVVVAVIAAVVIAADQIAKAWAQATLPQGRQVTVVPGWVWFRLAQNSGATLGLLSGYNLLFIALSILIVIAVVLIASRGYVTSRLGAIALGAIAGGGVSNLADRLRLGSVIDFIEVNLWPTDFNLADAAIRIGVVLFLIALVLEVRRRPRPVAGTGSLR
jgi:signal peptidase II